MANFAVIGVLSSFALASLCGGVWKWHRSPKRLYFKRLRRLLEEMPFIYRGDVPTTVLDDYVDTEYELVSLPGTAKERSNRPKSLHEAIRERRRVLILGDAGMGKTTFVRYSLLRLISDPGSATFLRDARECLPVFIPLKAIDNSEKNPIFRYITSDISYFSGPKGLARFKKLAERGRLLVCLDGYDEIPLAASARNYIREELNEIFSTPPYRASEVSSLSLINCALWLSSRQVFFYANRIEGIAPSSDVVAIKLVGVGERRLRIIKNIFMKYESGKHITAGLLDPEYFLGQIDSSAGEDVVALSHNPLFLTVLCYIYVTQVMERGTHEIEAVDNINELIIVCVDLLISDLDENKARDLAPARRAALLRRRNAFTAEKRDFLRFFAFSLLVQAVSTFGLEFLKAMVREYFTVVARSEKSTLIISELSRDRQTNPHFALQLVYCGVFAIASMDDTRTTYDFAHRRFREVLGSEYLTTPERYLELMKKSDSPALSEFLRVFRRSAHWRDDNLHAGALRLVFSRCVSDRSAALVVASNGLVAEKPLGLDLSREIEQFLLTILQVDQPRFRLGTWMLWLCPEDPRNVESAERSLTRAWESKDELKAVLAFRTLWHFVCGRAGLIFDSVDEVFWPKSHMCIDQSLGTGRRC
jgi:hypothetical protein